MLGDWRAAAGEVGFLARVWTSGPPDSGMEIPDRKAGTEEIRVSYAVDGHCAPRSKCVGRPAPASARVREPSGHDRLDMQETAIRRDPSHRRGSFGSGHWRQPRRVFPDGGPSGQQSGRPVSVDIWRGKTVLLQDSNPRVSSALIARFGRIGSHESQDHWNDKRTLVTLTLDDGRSSSARSRAFVAAPKSTMPDALGAKTPIATLHLQLVGLWFWGNFLCRPDSTPLSCCPWRPRHCPRAPKWCFDAMCRSPKSQY